MKILNKIFGDPNKKVIDKLRPILDQVNSLEDEFKKLEDKDFSKKTEEFKETLRSAKDKNKMLDEILPKAFALTREAAKRTISQRHFDEQILGAITLHRGDIAEMKTGEGKTLTSTLAAYLNALSGDGVHIITVNDYLARRDGAWMGQIFAFLGLSVGVIIHETAFRYNSDSEEKLEQVARKDAYNCDITYGTNNEFGFDYLRDNMAPILKQKSQRPFNYAIIDEVDSILIDEARTPLIISAPKNYPTKKYYEFARLIPQLKENEHYNVDEKMRAATLTEEGMNKMEKLLGVENIYTSGGIADVHHIEQALKAQTLFTLDKDYVVREGEVMIVDEFTGRLMPGRRYSEGLHQAIEAKENLEVKQESMTLASVTFQNYFRLYKKLAGMTGTALTEAEEFSKIYALDVSVIPTHKPITRIDLGDRIYKNENVKFEAVVREVKERHEKGQPILVGTISIEKNELLGNMLAREDIKYELLNAKNHEREAAIIADAGRAGAVTVATNMAGRGVDIVLGGVREKTENWEEEHKKVLELGGLFVIGTERHESRRIDNQLRGRSGRQGDSGVTQFFVSLEDDLMRIFGGSRIQNLMERFNFPEDVPIENKIITRSIESAQKKVEGNNFDIRKHLLDYDDVVNKHRLAIYGKRDEILRKYEEDKKMEDASLGKLKKEIFVMVEEEIEQVVSFHSASENMSDWNIKEMAEVFSTITSISAEEKNNFFKIFEGVGDKLKVRTESIEFLISIAKKEYKKLTEKALDAGVKIAQVEKEVILRSIDNLWIEHLEAIDYLRTGIGLRGYGQMDPLVEYKKEAYKMFTELNNLIRKQIVYNIFKVGFVRENFASSPIQAENMKFSAPEKGGGDNAPIAKLKIDKVGRNNPCPCGSGKKYKKCHGA